MIARLLRMRKKATANKLIRLRKNGRQGQALADLHNLQHLRRETSREVESEQESRLVEEERSG